MFFKYWPKDLARVKRFAQHCCVSNTSDMNQTTITMRVALNGMVKGEIAEFEFGAHVHNEPSIDGIYEGRVCQLSIVRGPDVLLRYDGGWCIPVPESCRGIYERVVKALEELPT